MATIKDVAAAAQVSTATVSAVLNGTAYVSPALRERIERAVRELAYRPTRAARVLRRGRSELIALCVADLGNPFYALIVRNAEAAAAAAGYALVVFNSEERQDTERNIIERVRTLGCDGMVLVPVGAPADYRGDTLSHPPTVLLGRAIEGSALDSVVIDNVAAGRRATEYLVDLGHRRVGTIAGRLSISTGQGRLKGMMDALRSRGLTADPRHVKEGAFREDVAYSVATEMLAAADRPTALYIANGVMALGVMRALWDLGLACPKDISIASTDTIAGHGGVSPRLTRTEHPVAEMTREAIRVLMDRIEGRGDPDTRRLVFAPELIVGDSCRLCAI